MAMMISDTIITLDIDVFSLSSYICLVYLPRDRRPALRFADALKSGRGRLPCAQHSIIVLYKVQTGVHSFFTLLIDDSWYNS